MCRRETCKLQQEMLIACTEAILPAGSPAGFFYIERSPEHATLSTSTRRIESAFVRSAAVVIAGRSPVYKRFHVHFHP
jgi:hypothetical protein